MATTDLTSTIAPFLDRHLVFPLLEFLQDRQLFPENDILVAKIDLLGKTNMVDYAMDIHKSLYQSDEVPAAMVERRAEVVARLKSLEEAAAPLVAFLQNPTAVQELRADRQHNLALLQEKYGIGSDAVEALYQYAKFQFECGNYSGAAEFLYQYRQLAGGVGERAFSVAWGKLASEILMQNWESAGEELNRLREMIDAKSFASPLVLLQQRTWLLHWSLFLFFNSEAGRSNFIDLCLQDKYLNAIQTNAPHLLRYLCAAALTCKRRRNALKDVVRVVEQEAHAYSDPLTALLLALLVEYDFDGAQERMKECEELLVNDFFLGKQSQEEGSGRVTVPLRDEVVDAARMLMLENYCRIHRCIQIKTLAERLGMLEGAAEQWLSALIRSSKLDACIDAEAGTVIMRHREINVYESIIERTRGLTGRTYALAANVAAAALVGGGAR